MKKILTKIACALIFALAITACKNQPEVSSSDPFQPLLSQDEIDELTIDSTDSVLSDGNWKYQTVSHDTSNSSVSFLYKEEMLSGLTEAQLAEFETWRDEHGNIRIPFNDYETTGNYDFSKNGEELKATNYGGLTKMKTDNSTAKKVLENIGYSWNGNIGTGIYTPTEEDYNSWIQTNLSYINPYGMKTNAEHNKYYREQTTMKEFLIKL